MKSRQRHATQSVSLWTAAASSCDAAAARRWQRAWLRTCRASPIEMKTSHRIDTITPHPPPTSSSGGNVTLTDLKTASQVAVELARQACRSVETNAFRHSGPPVKASHIASSLLTVSRPAAMYTESEVFRDWGVRDRAQRLPGDAEVVRGREL